MATFAPAALCGRRTPSPRAALDRVVAPASTSYGGVGPARGARAVARVALRALGLLDEARVEGQEVLRPYARLWHRFWLNTVMRPFVSVWEAHVARPARRVFGLLAELQTELLAHEKAGRAF